MTGDRKPHFRVVQGQPTQVIRPERKPSPQVIEAQRRHGKPFGVETWDVGEGPRFWTHDRIGRLAAMNEEDRMKRKKEAR